MALEVSIGSRVGRRARGGDSTLFHGTSLDAAKSLLASPHLDVAIATDSKIDGPLGFFLAAVAVDAQFFALRRAPGAVLRYRFSGTALGEVIASGATLQAMVGNPPYFEGPELWIPPTAFETFNTLLDAGEIDVTP